MKSKVGDSIRCIVNRKEAYVIAGYEITSDTYLLDCDGSKFYLNRIDTDLWFELDPSVRPNQCPVISNLTAMQQTNLVKPKGPKFKPGDHIRSIFYPEVTRIVRFVGGGQYIISPTIPGLSIHGEVDAQTIDDAYELCGIPEEIPVVESYCHHDWKPYVGIYNWYDYCDTCGAKRDSDTLVIFKK